MTGATTWPRLTATACGAAGFLALAIALGSLSRPMSEDQAVTAYLGFLVANGWVPYRDFFDVNAPGTHLISAAIGSMTGYGEFGARLVDLAWLAGLLALSWGVLRRRGLVVAGGAAAFVALVYLSGGPALTLEREVLLLPFVAGALLLEATAAGPIGPTLGAGALVGIAVTIKPQAALFLVPLAADAWVRTGHWRAPASLAVAAAGAPLAVATWLAYAGALDDFQSLTTEYWPLYAAISGELPHSVASTPAVLWWRRLHGALTFGLHPALPLAGAAFIGARCGLADRDRLVTLERRHVWLLTGMLVAAWMAVIPGAKFWAYHWWPFAYFAILLGAHALSASAPRRVATPVTLVLLFSGVSWADVGPYARSPRVPFTQVQRMSDYLVAHAEPGDTAVPLDWIDGALHAMLRARMLPGTRFVYDFHFYHHVSSPYIQELRAAFIDALWRNQPRFVIRVHQPERFAGPDTAADFPELDALMAARYRPALSTPEFAIWERLDAH